MSTWSWVRSFRGLPVSPFLTSAVDCSSSESLAPDLPPLEAEDLAVFGLRSPRALGSPDEAAERGLRELPRRDPEGRRSAPSPPPNGRGDLGLVLAEATEDGRRSLPPNKPRGLVLAEAGELPGELPPPDSSSCSNQKLLPCDGVDSVVEIAESRSLCLRTPSLIRCVPPPLLEWFEWLLSLLAALSVESFLASPAPRKALPAPPLRGEGRCGTAQPRRGRGGMPGDVNLSSFVSTTPGTCFVALSTVQQA